MMTSPPLPRLDIPVHDAQAAFVSDDHRFSLLLGGIGAGKTTAGAVKALRYLTPGSLGLVIAPSFRMLRDASWRTALELWGRLGLAEQVLRGDELRVVFANGAEALFRSAEDPERLRGPNASWAWIDEGALCHPDTWPIVIGRLRQHGLAGRCWVTTTPKTRDVGQSNGENWVRRVFVTDRTDETALYRASTSSNPFLPDTYVHSLRQQYTARMARQELDADWVLDVEGALFTLALIHAQPAPADLVRVVVAVDPSGGSDDAADEQGIIVAGRGADGRGYILADRSCRLSPAGWGRRAVQAAIDYAADAIVVERNYGGDMAEAVVTGAARSLDTTVTVKMVTASRGKRLRAEPVAALYEQGKVSHCGTFAELEAQMCSWTPESGTSPDRLDALVWSLTDLMVKEQRAVYVY
jgi:phage terminase large subunit-like protein